MNCLAWEIDGVVREIVNLYVKTLSWELSVICVHIPSRNRTNIKILINDTSIALLVTIYFHICTIRVLSQTDSKLDVHLQFNDSAFMTFILSSLSMEHTFIFTFPRNRFSTKYYYLSEQSYCLANIVLLPLPNNDKMYNRQLKNQGVYSGHHSTIFCMRGFFYLFITHILR